MFKHKGVHQCTWHQDALGWRSVIDFVVVSSDLQLYVLDTQVKRGAELSTDHNLVVSWIRWQGRKLDRLDRHKYIVRVCWERLAEPSVREVFTSHLQIAGFIRKNHTPAYPRRQARVVRYYEKYPCKPSRFIHCKIGRLMGEITDQEHRGR